MRIACLFDGAGLARLGLEQAGHQVTGYELDPTKVRLGKHLGSGNVICQDATTVDLTNFDAVWASPPCQLRSVANKINSTASNYGTDYLNWCLTKCKQDNKIWWIENTLHEWDNNWGSLYNAIQFDPLPKPRQNRNRIIGGRYKRPTELRPYTRCHKDALATVMATEYKGCATDKRRKLTYQYGSVPPVEFCGWLQGLDELPFMWQVVKKKKLIYEAIGNGVPVYMAKAFGDQYT